MTFPSKKVDFCIPADVPVHKVEQFTYHYQSITKNTNNLFLFAGDQKIEHLQNSFYGNNIDPADNDPEHLFRIAQEGAVGAFATQLGLIARYGKQYPHINYIVKLNSKTNIISKEVQDPLSTQLWSVEQVVEFKENSKLPICGVGYTVYLGSEYESEMLAQAAQVIYKAHQYGLVAIIWMYPRGKNVTHELDGNLIAGAAGVALALGADFAKINVPQDSSATSLAIACQAAGNTKLICSGGAVKTPEDFFVELYEQMHKGNTAGSACGRNIHQRSLSSAIAYTKALHALIYNNATVAEALQLYYSHLQHS